MKMSDVLSQDEIKYRGWLQLSLKDTEDNEKWNAVQEAVRGHDKLVELNNELIEALESIIKIALIPPRDREEAYKSIRKAKELNQ